MLFAPGYFNLSFIAGFSNLYQPLAPLFVRGFPCFDGVVQLERGPWTGMMLFASSSLSRSSP